MKATTDPMGAGALARQGFNIPLTREFLTVVISTAALIVLCRLFAPSSIAYGTLAGSLPFAAILVIVGLGQMLVVQQGGFRSLGRRRRVARGRDFDPLSGGRQRQSPARGAAGGVLRARRRHREWRAGRLRAAERDRRHDRHERLDLWRRIRRLRRHSKNDNRLAGGNRRRRHLGRRELRLLCRRDPARRDIRLEKDGRRTAVRGDRGKSAGGPGRRASRAASSDDGLRLRPVALLHCRPFARRDHQPTDGLSGRLAPASFGRRRGSRRHFADRRSRLSRSRPRSLHSFSIN